MRDIERVLISMLRVLDQNEAAVTLELFIADEGPLSDEAGEVVKAILSEKCNEV